MNIRLSRSDYRIILIVLLVAAASLTISVKYFPQAFPEASITFKVNREESASIARQFLQSQGVKLDGYDHAALFRYDEDAKLYLERTKGLEAMNNLARGPVHLWRWQNRWFRSQQKEEFRVAVSPLGEVVSFDHELPEAAPGANLDSAAARQLSERFITQVFKKDLGDLEFVETVSAKRPARTDHTFTWKQKSVDLGEGSLRVEVGVSGDQVTSFNEYVKILDQWRRDYDRIRSRNDSAQIVDEVFWILLSVVMFGILIVRLRDRDVPIKLGLGVGGVGAVLYLCGQFNDFSTAKFGYGTTDPYSSFLGSFIAGNAFAAIGVGVALFIVVAASEPAYREGLPEQMSIRRALSWRGLRTKSFFIANVVGLGMTFFFFAYQAIFYVVANHFGAWAPYDTPFTNDLNTAIPWVAVLFGGFLPAITEEFQFRAFAIPFLHKYLRNWPLAIVLSAFNWGFLHSAYPNQPFFIRGLEVGLGGIVIGFVMIRFGIVATLIWHYSVDALYTAFLLLRSPNHYLMISGGLTAGIMLIPLTIALVAYLRSGTFGDGAELTNAKEGVSRAPAALAAPPVEAALDYQPLSRSRVMMAGGLIVVAVVLAALPAQRFGRDVKLGMTREQAIDQANHYLAAHGIGVEGYTRTATLTDNLDPLAVKYIMQFRGVKDADKLYRQLMPLALWQVRYFRPLQKEECWVWVDTQGGPVFGFLHLLDEDAPGAELSSDAALALGTQFVASTGFDLSDYNLQNSAAEKKKAREDYALTWQARDGDRLNVGEAHARVDVGVAGDHASSFRRSYKLPEDWERKESARSLANILLIAARYLAMAGLIGGAIWLLVRRIRDDGVRWKPALGVGLAVGALFLAFQLNALNLVQQQYNTSMPYQTFELQAGIGIIVVVLLVAVMAWVVVAFATSLYPDIWRIFDPAARRVWARDAVVGAGLTLALGAAANNLEAMLFSRFHAYASVGGDVLDSGFAHVLPGAAFLLKAVPYAVLATCSLAILIRLVTVEWRRRAVWLWLVVGLLVLSLGPSGAHSVPEYLIGWSADALRLLVVLGALAYFLRNNIAAYLTAALVIPLIEPAEKLLSSPVPFFRWNGVALVVGGALVLVWLLLPRPKAAP